MEITVEDIVIVVLFSAAIFYMLLCLFRLTRAVKKDGFLGDASEKEKDK